MKEVSELFGLVRKHEYCTTVKTNRIWNLVPYVCYFKPQNRNPDGLTWNYYRIFILTEECMYIFCFKENGKFIFTF